MIPTFFNAMMTIMLANWALNDLPHAAGLLGNRNDEPATSGQIQYIAILCQQLKITRSYEEQVGTFGEAGRTIRELEAEKRHRKQLGSRSPNPTTKLYHVTHKDNLSGIMAEGLKRQNQWTFFFATFETAEESGLSDMAILEVTLTDEDISKCEIGELFPELFEEKFGEQPPNDVNLKDYLENPKQYGVAEVCCTIDRIPPERIKYIKTIKRMEYSNPSTFRIEHTTVDKIIDDLERTWHRIESDMSYRMQSALGILKNVMGYYYEEPCVVAWDNSDLVGIAVYETLDDRDRGIRIISLKELASFSYEPGVGKTLVEEIIRIGREEDSDIVSASHGPGARKFYEKLGFIKDTYHPEEPTLMMYRLKSSSPDTAVGTCYEDAWRFILKEEAGHLVHGTVYSPGLRKRIDHAWVETDAGYIWEPQTKGYYTVVGFEEVAAPIVEHRYTTTEAAIMAARTIGIHPYGPWTEEERAKWLGTTPR